MSLIQNMVLIQKASFPRLFLPLSTCLVNLFDMLVGLSLFLIALALYNPIPWDHLFMFPLVFLNLILFCFAISLWFSSMSVRFKDLIIAIPYLLQVGIFVCPIGFPTALFPPSLKFLFCLNPLVGIIDGFRWSLLGEGEMFYSFSYSVCMTFFLTWTGYRTFKRVELHLADII
jgi:lipopolysaccharide transport system permease protein